MTNKYNMQLWFQCLNYWAILIDYLAAVAISCKPMHNTYKSHMLLYSSPPTYSFPLKYFLVHTSFNLKYMY